MSCRLKIIGLTLGLLMAAFPSALTSQVLPTTAPPKSNPGPSDPYGRVSPSGTVLGFLQAAQAGNYGIASQYLQMPASRRISEGERIAQQLKTVMDGAFNGNPNTFSNQPEGTPQEGVPLDRQKLGMMSSGDAEGELEVVRVNDATSGKIWLISSETLVRVPELYDQVQARRVETTLPKVLVKSQFIGMPLWQWLAMLLGVVVAAAVSWLVLALLEVPLRAWARRKGQHDVASWKSVSGPAWFLVGTLVHEILASYVGMPLLHRHYYFQFTAVALVLSASWLLWRGIQWFLRRMRNRALTRSHFGTASLMLLGERIIKAVVFVAAVLAVFTSLGFNMSTALAGLGIGGLAIGFGAQKTIENLFGGVSVLGDEVMRVGDVCRFGDRTGVVEDIGLRSTRVRTDDRTLLAIPNGTVATINVENLSRRDKILFKTNIALRIETTADHLRFVLAETRRLLYSHAKVESRTVRVRLVDIASGSHTIEVFSYILTQDFNEFAAIREDLLLRMIDVVEDSGTGLALPSQTLYVRRDSGVEEEKAGQAEKKIAELRASKQLPFPDYSEEDINSLRGSIEYPQPESALHKDNRT